MNGCNLCPRRCNADRNNNKLGICGCNTDMRIANISLHKWEEPFISGQNGAGTIFFSGCSLGCVFCQNHEISRSQVGKIYTDNDLIAAIRELEKAGATNIEFVTPTHYTDKILSVLKKYKPSIPVVWNSSGYENKETLKSLEGYVDIFMPDLKFFSPSISAEYANCPNYFKVASEAISEMYRQTGKCEFDADGILKKGTVIRHLVLPSHMHDSFKILEFIAEKFSDNIFVSIMCQYFPTEELCAGNKYPEIARKLHRKEYKAVINKFLALGLRNGYAQEMGSANAKFVPTWIV